MCISLHLHAFFSQYPCYCSSSHTVNVPSYAEYRKAERLAARKQPRVSQRSIPATDTVHAHSKASMTASAPLLSSAVRTSPLELPATLQLQISKSLQLPQAAMPANAKQSKMTKPSAEKVPSLNQKRANKPNKKQEKESEQPDKKKWKSEQLEKKKWNPDKKKWKGKQSSVGSHPDSSLAGHSSPSNLKTTKSSSSSTNSWSSRKSERSDKVSSPSSSGDAFGSGGDRRNGNNAKSIGSTPTSISRSTSSSSSSSRDFDLQCPGGVDGKLVQYWRVHSSDLQRQAPVWATPNK